MAREGRGPGPEWRPQGCGRSRSPPLALTSRGPAGSVPGRGHATRGRVIAVDFRARRRRGPGRPGVPRDLDEAARGTLEAVRDVLLFWRPPAGRAAAEYLGGRWDWGWTLFVWTSEAAVGPVWSRLVGTRGYVPQRLGRDAFVRFLERAVDIGGLLLDGELEGGGEVIRAEPDQLIRREDALSALGA